MSALKPAAYEATSETEAFSRLEAKRARKNGKSRSVRVYSCDGCEFVRELVDDPDERKRMTWSPLYGNLTIGQLAQKDIQYHVCKQYNAALVRAKYRRHVARRTSVGV